jgi:hypothetical protein
MKVVVYGPEHYPLKEYRPPGLYVREIFMPAGHFILGARHLTEHINTISKGRVLVMMDGVIQEFTAPCSFISKPGVAKRLLIIEDCVWSTYHPVPNHGMTFEALRNSLVVTEPGVDPAQELAEMSAFIRKEIKQ